MRSNLADKDKGIQKYFVDINIQNKKLESLLQSMEMAHNSSLRDELCLDFSFDSPEKSLPLSNTFDKMADGLSLEEQVTEEGADSELLVGDSMAEGTDPLDEMVTASTTESGDLEFVHSTPGPQALTALPLVSQEEGLAVVEQAVQTDVVPFSPAISELIESVLKLQDSCPTSSASPDESGADSMESFSESLSALMVDLTPRSPNSAILLSPVEIPFSKAAMEVRSNRLMRELDFCSLHRRKVGQHPLAVSGRCCEAVLEQQFLGSTGCGCPCGTHCSVGIQYSERGYRSCLQHWSFAPGLLCGGPTLTTPHSIPRENLISRYCVPMYLCGLVPGRATAGGSVEVSILSVLLLAI